MKSGLRFLLWLISALLPLPVAAHAADGAARWDASNSAALVDYARNIASRGIAPAAYDPSDLAAALEREDGLAMEIAASALFAKIARDFSTGVTPVGQRRLWRFAPREISDDAIGEAMTEALAGRNVAGTLDAFAPPHADYRKLLDALSSAGNDRERLLIRRNMERWRWLPRDFGPSYVLVNIPSFEAVIVRDGEEVARRKVVVGARKSPTPQFSATISGVTLNPTWYVPASIVAESVGALLDRKPKEAERLGYYRAEDGGVRQKPGPKNSLGRMKLAMPNPYSVFIHDTPNKGAFNLDRRALSHGCVRVEDAIGFASALLDDAWSKSELDELIESGSTISIDLSEPLPVYALYFTMMSDASGALAAYDDIYSLDKGIFATDGSGRVDTADIASECPAIAPAQTSKSLTGVPGR